MNRLHEAYATGRRDVVVNAHAECVKLYDRARAELASARGVVEAMETLLVTFKTLSSKRRDAIGWTRVGSAIALVESALAAHRKEYGG